MAHLLVLVAAHRVVLRPQLVAAPVAVSVAVPVAVPVAVSVAVSVAVPEAVPVASERRYQLLPVAELPDTEFPLEHLSAISHQRNSTGSYEDNSKTVLRLTHDRCN